MGFTQEWVSMVKTKKAIEQVDQRQVFFLGLQRLVKSWKYLVRQQTIEIGEGNSLPKEDRKYFARSPFFLMVSYPARTKNSSFIFVESCPRSSSVSGRSRIALKTIFFCLRSLSMLFLFFFAFLWKMFVLFVYFSGKWPFFEKWSSTWRTLFPRCQISNQCFSVCLLQSFWVLYL